MDFLAGERILGLGSDVFSMCREIEESLESEYMYLCFLLHSETWQFLEGECVQLPVLYKESIKTFNGGTITVMLDRETRCQQSAVIQPLPLGFK